MQIECQHRDEHSCRFLLSGALPSFANSIRRAMASEVPKLAIENVRIYDNTSGLFDEMLAHRLGLIPIRTEEGTYVPIDECTCEGAGCNRCSVSYTLSVEGPGMVYSRDLIPDDPVAVPALGDIPIVKLEKGQKVVLEAQAVLSTGRTHAKWQPTTVCGYKNYPCLTIDARCDGCGACVDVCPRNVLRLTGRCVAVDEGRLEDCSLCRLCEKSCLSTGIGETPAIRVGIEPDRFIFNVESDGAIPATAILRQSIRFLRTRADELSRALEEIAEG
ncbi:MAG TPA: DNA-directed RNA polymerase subunit D [Methanoregulaceae archaeon]|nr:DNA-directed RNA polymerase subunit D [Methanoregulaceae archaeon]HOV67248.1 DNA-directed RNA polymerase subunit D [Methanoregulaceae archaeon]HQJ88514.1 DNA-directed RNA polymerase subunit D [Methanoregulaceae archaeon]